MDAAASPIPREQLAGRLDLEADQSALARSGSVLIDEDRDDVSVQQMRHLIADRDDVQLVPFVRLVVGIDHGRLAERGDQTWILSLLGPHGLALPRDDPSAGRLLVELTGVTIAGAEVVLDEPHVTLVVAYRIGRRSTTHEARTPSL